MRVLHYYHHFLPCRGGVESVIAALCRHARRAGHAARVACLDTCAKSRARLPAYSVEDGTPVHRHRYLALGPYRVCPGALRHAPRADVLHVHGLGFFLDALVLSRPFHGKPVVFSTHGGIFHTPRHAFLKKLYFNAWARAVLAGVDRVVAVSEHDRALFASIVAPEKLVVIENGADLAPFLALRAPKDPARIAFVGRLSRNKQPARLLDAFAALCRRRPNAFLDIVGGDYDGLLEGLRARAQRKGIAKRVRFHGALDERALRGVLARASVFASASSYEGFGIAALEALAAGCVPVLNDIPPFRRLLEGSGVGALADFSSPREAARALARALDHAPAQREKARALAQRHDWGARAARYLALYREVAA